MSECDDCGGLHGQGCSEPGCGGGFCQFYSFRNKICFWDHRFIRTDKPDDDISGRGNHNSCFGPEDIEH